MTTAAKIRRFLAKGLSVDDIAKRLGIPKARVQTVRWRENQKNIASKNKFLDKMDRLATKPTRTTKEILDLFDSTIPTAPISPSLVDHPPHYTAGGVETIDFIEAKDLNYRLGNAVKYISRAVKKNSDPVQDLEKAVWYLKREIDARKNA